MKLKSLKVFLLHNMATTIAVLSQSGQSLYFYDLQSGQCTDTIDNLIAEPHELCYDSDSQLLYFSHTYRHGHFWTHGENAYEISVVDVKSKKIVDTIDTRPAKAPHGLILDRPRGLLYASVEELPGGEGGGVIGIDLSTRKVVKSVSSKYKTHWFVMTPDGKKAYTCNKTAPYISVLDLEQQSMIGTIPTNGCEEPCISHDGRYAYFPTPGFRWGLEPPDPVIQVIETSTDMVVDAIKVDAGMISTLTTPHDTILATHYHFASNSTAEAPKFEKATLSMYSASKRNKIGEVEIGTLPLTIRHSPDGRTAFVANIFPGTVSVIDLDSMKVLRTLDIDLSPRSDKPLHQGAHGIALI